MIEWLDSPVVYRAVPGFLPVMRDAVRQTHQRTRSFHHYVHMARKNYREHLCGDTVRLKKYFYALRPLLATLWLERGLGVVPMRFGELLNALELVPAVRAAIDELLIIKATASESQYGPPLAILNAFIHEELQRLESVLLPLSCETDFSVLDRLLLDTVLRASPSSTE